MSLAHRLQHHPAVHAFKGAADRHRLTVALILAVLAALVLVGISVSMYYMAGFYRYDLSRPGYEKERTEIAKPSPQKTYNTTSPVTKATIDSFLQELDTRQKNLTAYGDYRDQSLSDEDLQLTTPGQ